MTNEQRETGAEARLRAWCRTVPYLGSTAMRERGTTRTDAGEARCAIVRGDMGSGDVLADGGSWREVERALGNDPASRYANPRDACGSCGGPCRTVGHVDYSDGTRVRFMVCVNCGTRNVG